MAVKSAVRYDVLPSVILGRFIEFLVILLCLTLAITVLSFLAVVVYTTFNYVSSIPLQV